MGCAISLLTLVLIASGELEPEPRRGKAGKSKADLSASSKAPAPPQIDVHAWQWKVLAALRAAASEEEAERALSGQLPLEDYVPALPADGDLFVEVDRLIRKSWWRASRAAIVRGRQHRMDLTAPVRRCVSELKQEAEELVRWLDPSYAHPASTPMAIQWAQNSSAVMIAARFSHKWEAPGANLAVYSTEKGQGHVNKDRTAESVRRLLRVNISSSRVEAEIIAKVQNSRKRFTLDLNLFDETIPHASGWTVEFRKARGSMQMSRGAEIPELHIHMRKRWPSPDYAWPRLADEAGAEMAMLEKEMQFSGPMLSESTLTCLRGSSLYCPASDSCTSSCSGCQGLGQARGSRCGASLAAQLEAASTGDSLGGVFLDEDLQPDKLGGLFRWVHRPELLAAEAFALCWARPLEASEATWKLIRPSDARLVAWEVQDSDPWPQLQVPNGTYLPADARHLVLVALPTVPAAEDLQGGLCSAGIPAAAASVMDRWRPAVEEMALAFEDIDPQPMSLLGSAKLTRIAAKAETAAPALSFELRWGRQQQGWWLVGDDNSSLIAKAAADEDDIVMEVRSSNSSGAGEVALKESGSSRCSLALTMSLCINVDIPQPWQIVAVHDFMSP
ncbi:unnamed protein product [Symbiodinium sp. CCMP2456]|nr:unnamed protein product [Symbiodinium sp. CCMP2456]